MTLIIEAFHVGFSQNQSITHFKLHELKMKSFQDNKRGGRGDYKAFGILKRIVKGVRSVMCPHQRFMSQSWLSEIRNDIYKIAC